MNGGGGIYYDEWGRPIPVAFTSPGPQADFRHPSSHFHEGQSEPHAVDELRWGDGDVVTRLITAADVAAASPIFMQSKQLARIDVNRSLVWLVQLGSAVADVTGKGTNQVPAGEANPITLDFAITIGCGMARTTMKPQITLTAPYSIPIGTMPPQFFFPAKDLQINCIVTYTPTVAGQVAIDVAAMVAPWTQLNAWERR